MFLSRSSMKTELHKQLTKALLNVQALLEDDYAEDPTIQKAFNTLVCAIDEEYYKDPTALYKDPV
jgi:hypothetical protein